MRSILLALLAGLGTQLLATVGSGRTLDAAVASRFAQQALDDIVAVAAAAGFEVVLEGAGRARRAGNGLDDRFGQHGAAEVGVQHRAGEVEHRLQARSHVRGDAPLNSRKEFGRRRQGRPAR